MHAGSCVTKPSDWSIRWVKINRKDERKKRIVGIVTNQLFHSKDKRVFLKGKDRQKNV